MPVDRRTWEAGRSDERAREIRHQNAAVALSRLRQAAVPIERLTGQEEWDSYLRHAEAFQEADRAELAEVTEQMTGAAYLAPEALAVLRHRATFLRVAIIARQEVLDLPKQILQLTQGDTKLALDALGK